MQQIKIPLLSLLSFILISTLFSNSIASAQYLFDKQYQNKNISRPTKDIYQTILIQKGTILKGVLQHKISSRINNVNDRVETMIMSDMQKDGVNCIPKGTKILGNISRITKPLEGENASIQIIFNTLKIPDQDNINMMAYIWTPGGYSTLGGELTEKTGYKRIVHNLQGIGGVVQLVPSGPRSMGTEREFQPGTELVIVLERDIILKILKE